MTENHGKIEVKRKWWVLARTPYFPKGSEKQSSGWKPKGERPPYVVDKQMIRHRQRLGEQAGPRAHSRYIHIKL